MIFQCDSSGPFQGACNVCERVGVLPQTVQPTVYFRPLRSMLVFPWLDACPNGEMVSNSLGTSPAHALCARLLVS